jgi:hypothetical protein
MTVIPSHARIYFLDGAATDLLTSSKSMDHPLPGSGLPSTIGLEMEKS